MGVLEGINGKGMGGVEWVPGVDAHGHGWRI